MFSENISQKLKKILGYQKKQKKRKKNLKRTFLECWETTEKKKKRNAVPV